MWKIVAAKKNFYCSKEHTARPQTASRREPRITSCWPLFLSGNKKQTKQEREKKNSLSLSLSLSLASQFLKTLLAAAFEASSARKLPATTIRNKSKLTRSPALLSLSLSLSLSVRCFLFRVFWETLDWGMVIGTRGKKGTNGL